MMWIMFCLREFVSDARAQARWQLRQVADGLTGVLDAISRGCVWPLPRYSTLLA
jgi:hypothetical protein